MRNVNHYPDELKDQVVQEVLSGRLTKEECRRRFGIKGKSTVLTWIRKFERQKDGFIRMGKGKGKEVLKLQEEIKQLRQQLRYEQLRTTALEQMINIAEEELKIGIRKKSGAKPSKK